VAAADKLRQSVFGIGSGAGPHPRSSRKRQVEGEWSRDDDTTPAAGDAALDLARLDNRAIASAKISLWRSMPATRTGE
jgi:hypothetical protein